jgi:hypothetical protein
MIAGAEHKHTDSKTISSAYSHIFTKQGQHGKKEKFIFTTFLKHSCSND